MGFRIDGYTPTTEYQGGNRVVKVREYHVYSLPSETYFQFRRGKRGDSWIDPRAAAKSFSDRIEAVLALPRVTDVAYSQDVTASGRLVDMMTTYYESADAAISGSVESDLAHFGPNFTGAQVADEIATGGDFLGAG